MIELSTTGKLIIRTPYSPAFVSAVKALGARWNKEEKVWIAEPEVRDQIDQLIRELFSDETSVRPEAGPEAKVTLRSRVDAVVQSPEAVYSGDTIDRMIYFAFQYGRETATKEVSDAYHSLIRGMRLKAKRSRYQFLINEAIGNKDFLSFPAYSGRRTRELGGLETKL